MSLGVSFESLKIHTTSSVLALIEAKGVSSQLLALVGNQAYFLLPCLPQNYGL